MRIALASCLDIPEPDPDEEAMLEAFRAAGAEARVLAWDDPKAPFADYDLVVIRSTWNYYANVEAFLAWVDRTPNLRNRAEVVRWSAVKTYLRDLEERGVATVPTLFVAQGEKKDLTSSPWDEIVVKPLVSAGSFRTERFARADFATKGQKFLDDLVRDRAAMIQKWMPAVDTYGERSLVWIDGEITHAVRKSPRFADGVEQVTAGEVPITGEERAFAMKAVAAARAPDLLYARVDVIEDEGVHRVMELELVEPSLFFKQSPRALDRFVRACLRG